MDFETIMSQLSEYKKRRDEITRNVRELPRDKRIEHEPWIVDRSGWEPGPWDIEPDKIEWRYRGLPCLIIRASEIGALAGYVGLPPSHPWYFVHYNKLPSKLTLVHGGLTYSDIDAGAIWHSEAEDPWWIGFDCWHAFDIMPGLRGRLRRAYQRTGETASPLPGDFGEEYRNIFYVKAEVEQLADQALRGATRYWRFRRVRRRKPFGGSGMTKKQIKERIHRNGRLRKRGR